MTLPLLGTPITIVTRTRSGVDAFGNDVFTTSTATVAGVFAPAGSVDNVQGEDVIVTQPRVFLPAGTTVTGIDAVEVDGVTYEVDGDPNVWVNPFTGVAPGIQLALRRVAG